MDISSSPSALGAHLPSPSLQLLPSQTAITTRPSTSSILTLAIASLPPEILLRVFELGAKLAELPSFKREKRVEQCRRRASFLCTTMLVCRTWRDLARLVLWRDLQLWKTGSPKVLESADWGMVRVQSLEVLSFELEDDDRTGISQIIAKLRQTKDIRWSLRMNDLGLHLGTDKEHPSYFSNCKSLRIESGTINFTVSSTESHHVRVFTGLESLTLQGSATSPDLFGSLSTRALTRLRLSGSIVNEGLATDGKLVEFLKSIAPRLTVLQIPHDFVPEPVLQILLSATRLVDLALEFEEQDLFLFLKNYPSKTLSHLTISLEPPVEKSRLFCKLLESLHELPSLSNLSDLDFLAPKGMDQWIFKSPEWFKEEPYWVGKGVKVRILEWHDFPSTWDDD